jgi:hypothetical protein
MSIRYLASARGGPNAGLYDIGIEQARHMPIKRRRVAMRANSIGPPRSAALVISSAAVRMTGVPRSDDGTVLTRCPIASRNDASLTPLGVSMGSAKRLS